MINMLKILVALTVLLGIIGFGLLGKRLSRVFIFKSAKTPNNESIYLEIVTGIVVAGVALAYYSRNKPDPDMFMWFGALVYFLGGLLQLFARRQLYEDKTFEARLSAGFEAAQMGLYSKIRHPSKSALLLLVLGFCFASGSIWAFGLYLILFVPSVLYRISQEDQALLDKFGERWLGYENDTKRIIPGIF